MYKKIDSYLIKAYKSILTEKLKDSTLWSMSSLKTGTFTSKKVYEWECSIKLEKAYVKFVVKYNDSVTITISNDLVYTFKPFSNLDLILKINKLRRMKKYEDKNNETLKKEMLMKNALPEDYKRSIKLSKIKNRM